MLLFPLLLATASADVAPGPFYKEKCTVEKKEQDGTTCEECGSSYAAGSDTGEPTCEDQYSGTDFAYVCQTWGASAWTEVWCDGPPREGCGCASAPGGVSWLLGLAIAALLRRRVSA